jgi:hypothetical protein
MRDPDGDFVYRASEAHRLNGLIKQIRELHREPVLVDPALS